MKIVYASSACSTQRFFETFSKAANLPGQQVQKYHRLMLEGLAINGASVVALTGPPVTRTNHSETLVNLANDACNGVDYRYLPVLNLPVVKNIVTFITSFASTYRLLSRDASAVVVCDVLNFSVSTGALLAAKALKRSSTGIVTDLPAHLNGDSHAFLTLLTSFAMKRYSSYVLLTQQMNDVVNQRRVPVVVIEGLVDVNMESWANELSSKHASPVCLYAGAIDRKYGIDSLVQGFLESRTASAELWIYGDGDFRDELKALAVANTRVKYFGTVPNHVVVKEQLRATLLVNPRPTTKEFTKYSFPSKNMEYMASGTPLMTTRLPGMPVEYLPYVYLLDDETPSGVAQALDVLLAEAGEVLHLKGGKAKAFVLLEKSNVVQAGRLLQLLESMTEGSRLHKRGRNSRLERQHP